MIIRDDIDVLLFCYKNILDGIEWESRLVDLEDGPLERQNPLIKQNWTLPAVHEQDQQALNPTS